MAALRIERDGDVLRVTLARPRRGTRSTSLIAELAAAFVDVGKARAVGWPATGRASAPAPTSRDAPPSTSTTTRTWPTRTRARHARGHRPSLAPVSRAGPGARTRRRCRPRRLLGHRGRGRARRVRLLGGKARDHPRRHLPLRAGEDRPERGPALLRYRRALRRGDGPPDGSCPRGLVRLGRRARGVLAELATAGSSRVTPREEARPRPAGRPRDGTEDRGSGARAKKARRAFAPSWNGAARIGSASTESAPGIRVSSRGRAGSSPGRPGTRSRTSRPWPGRCG